MKEQTEMERLLKIMETLRGDAGCPWDKAQTHTSLRQYMLEEAYEVADAIDGQDDKNLCEELGDVLLQVVFHAQVAQERGAFDFEDVARGICEKMIHRHPHIFQKDGSCKGLEKTWEELKKAEKKQQTQTQVLRAVPKAMPALVRGQKVLTKAGENTEITVEKFPEIAAEFFEKITRKSLTEADFGEFLLQMINISRFFQINAEFALTNATEKFINRFENVENTLLSES